MTPPNAVHPQNAVVVAVVALLGAVGGLLYGHVPLTGATSLATAMLTNGRANHTMSSIGDGRLLLTGGDQGFSDAPTLKTQSDIELLDAGGRTIEVVGSLLEDRSYHEAAVMPDGRLMLMGGTDASLLPVRSTEIVNLDFTTAEGPEMRMPRSVYGSLVLPSGDVLAVGGYTQPGALPTASIEVLSVSNPTWSEAGEMLHRRAGHTLSLLSDGRVLIIGGYDGQRSVAEAEIWDPRTGVSHPAGRLATPRFNHRAVSLHDGSVAVFGGTDDVQAISGIEVWSFIVEDFHPAGHLLNPRVGHTATKMSDGSVVLLGGTSSAESPELWTPTANMSSAIGDVEISRAWHTAFALESEVWAIGGVEAGSYPLDLTVVSLPSS